MTYGLDIFGTSVVIEVEEDGMGEGHDGLKLAYLFVWVLSLAAEKR